jgi:hypothetical protein
MADQSALLLCVITMNLGILGTCCCLGDNLNSLDVATYVAANKTALAERERWPLDRKGAFHLTAEELARRCASNQASAGAAFKGKTLEVTGAVEGLYRESMERLTIILQGNVYCELWDDLISQPRSPLKKGVRLTVVGRFAGFSNSSRCHLELKACELK